MAYIVPHLAAQPLAQVLQPGTYRGALSFGESRLAAAVGDLQKEFSHGGVDRIADKIGVERLKDSLADQYFGSHGSRMGHSGAANRLNQGLLNITLLDVEAELTGALLRCTPAHTVGESRYVFDLLGLHPLSLLGMGAGPWQAPLVNGHMCSTSAE